MLAIGSLAAHSDFSNEISKTNPNVWFEFNQLNLAAGATISDTIKNQGTDYSQFDISGIGGNPIVGAVGLMSLKSIDFDGTDDNLRLANTFTSTNKAFCVACAFHKDDGGNDVLISENPDGTGFYIRIAGSNGRIDMRMGESYDTNKAFDISPDYSANRDNLVIINRNTSGHVFIYNQNVGSTPIASNTSNADILAMPKMIFQNIGASANDIDGQIGEFMVWDRELTATEIENVQREMTLKWSMAAL